MNKLQKALSLNLIFSGITGILAIVFHHTIASIFAIEQSHAFWIIGIALLYFAATILLEIKKQRKIAVLWIIIQDITWVAASAIILLYNPFSISIAGNYTIATIAFIVLFMAINQYRALAQVFPKQHL